MGQKEDKDEYIESLELFEIKLAKLLNAKNKETDSMQGYVGLIIRDLSVGNIDAIHNCKNKSVLVNVLKLAINSIINEIE
jgi:hypothetical protein